MKHPETSKTSIKSFTSNKINKAIDKNSKDKTTIINNTITNNSNVINTPKNNAALQKFIKKANSNKQIVEKVNKELNKPNSNKSNNNLQEDEKLQVVVDDFFVSCEDNDNLPVLVAKTKEKGFLPDVRLVVKENFDNWRGRGAASRFHREFYEDELKYKKKKMNW